MKTKILDPEKVVLEETGGEWLTLKIADQKYVMDMDTLIDLSFRCAAFLSYLEQKEEDAAPVCICKNLH